MKYLEPIMGGTGQDGPPPKDDPKPTDPNDGD